MRRKTKAHFRFLAALLVLVMVFTASPAVAHTTTGVASVPSFTITNPYEGIDWDSIGRYRAALHVHTERSDGGPFGDTVLHHYNLGFDILAITDHNVTHPGPWDDGGAGALTAAQAAALMAGTYDGIFPTVGGFGPALARDPGQGGMIYIPFTNEQSHANDVNTFWADFNNAPGWTNLQIFEAAAAAGGIATINHPGRYTGGAGGGAGGIMASTNPLVISRYMEWLDRFPIIAGMEIFNRMDNETRSDRVLWDNLLQERMPYGLPVWGFAVDDSHSLYEIGFNWNVMLLAELTAENTRTAMEEGAFYAVTRVNRGVGPADTAINATLPGGAATPIMGTPATAFMLEQETPSIARIAVAGNTIIVEGVAGSYEAIEWVADGEIIHTGGTLDLAAHADSIHSNYVRAQLVGAYGMALTQPFGVFPAGEAPAVRPTACNLVSIDPPRQINADLNTAITAAELRLPPMVTLVSDRNWRVPVSVEWDLTSVTSTAAEATFTVPGTFSLPADWTNTEDIPLTTTVELNIAPLIITPIRDVIEMPNEVDQSVYFTVEGYVSAAYRTDMVYIQDGSGPWRGIWVTVPGGQVIEGYVGEWVRVTGYRSVQWAQPAVRTSLDDVQVLHGDARGRPALTVPPLSDFTIIPEPVPAVWNGPWQATMITFTAQVLERDAGHFQQGTYGLVPYHRMGGAEGLQLLLIVDYMPANIQNGDWVHVDQALLRWRGGSLAHVAHANMMDGVVTRIDGVPETHRAFMTGDGAGQFRPGDNMRRGEIAAVLARTMIDGFQANTYPAGMTAFTAFSDVGPGDWFYFYVAWAYEAGLVQGHGDGRFAPEAFILREELAAMLARTGAFDSEGALAFADDALISNWARDYVYAMRNIGWLAGDAGNNFRPLDNITRAEGATAMNRALGRVDSIAALANADVENPEAIRSFSDVSEESWYFASVVAAANAHLLTRNADGEIVWMKILVGAA